jgi:DNA-binding GntR family transcriptional regulator
MRTRKAERASPRQAERGASASQGHNAYLRLIAEVRAGKLRPNDRLTETEIAARFGISRTPVREAIRQLEADGLVLHAPRVGAVVRSLDYSEISELYEMRAVLEGTAARLTARTASATELAELEAINAEMRHAAGDVGRLYELNRDFHFAMLNAAKNRYLASSVGALQKTLLILGPSTMGEGSRADAALAEHAEVLAAIRMRDEEAAEDAMRRHIQGAHRARLRQIRERAHGAGKGEARER